MPNDTWEESHYGTLGVNWNASRQEIRQARRTIRQLCPAKSTRSDADASFFRDVKAACKFLLNSERREIYNCGCSMTAIDTKLKWQRKANKWHKRREASEKRVVDLISRPFPNDSKTFRVKNQEMRKRKKEAWAQYLMDHYECFGLSGLQHKLHLLALPADGHKHELITRLLRHHGAKYDCVLIDEKKHKHQLKKHVPI